MPNSTVRRRLFKQRRFRLLLALLLIVSLILGVAIVPFERKVGNITTIFDGLWWAITTITTVGYGDKVPVTDSGKVLGIILQILGAMMFGSIVAIISNYMSRAQDEFYWNRLFTRLDRIESQVEELQKRTGFMVRSEDTVPTKDTKKKK
jgi:voltage-gated potassium channel